jgi:uncharacterized membrane-anchored protein YjiN (DUF445 family)
MGDPKGAVIFLQHKLPRRAAAVVVLGQRPTPWDEGNGLEQEPRWRLRRSRRLATGLLGLAGIVFLASLTAPQPQGWLLLLRSVAEAALVGGLADWFAVTALFRHPLGLPIPHTAIVPANKDRIGEGLARFLDRNFLTRELLLPELRALHVADRLAAWLSDRRNAGALAAEIAKALPFLLRAFDDSQIKAFLRRALGAALRNTALAPIAGQILRALTAAGYHEAVLDSGLDYARAFLARNGDKLLAAVAERRRGWIPKAVHREIARAMLRAAHELIDDLRKSDGTARKSLLAAIDEAAAELANSSAPARVKGLSGLLRQPELQAWLAASWDRMRGMLLADLGAPSSRIRRTLALALASVGETLAADGDMRERFDSTIEAVVAEALPWRAELIRFVAEVVRQWEPRSFSDRIEAAVGADLQYIRINGTIVGGLVGGGLYLVSLLAR